jgi:catechol 2,3-dioxygenase-like lactoylglutathione lyase family enzyme
VPGTPFRLHHVQVSAPAGSEVRARAFFVQLLGMKEIPKPPSLAGRGGIWLELEGTQLHIGIDPKFQPADKAHPAFETAALDELRQRLTRYGVETWQDESLPGRRRFYVRDPFGNRLEFVGPEGG